MTAKISDSQRDALNSSVEAFGLEKTKEILTSLIDQGGLSNPLDSACTYRQDYIPTWQECLVYLEECFQEATEQ